MNGTDNHLLPTKKFTIQESWKFFNFDFDPGEQLEFLLVLGPENPKVLILCQDILIHVEIFVDVLKSTKPSEISINIATNKRYWSQSFCYKESS